MYSITASDVIKFVTNDFISVKTIGAQTEVIGDSAAIGAAASDDSSAQWDVENDAVDGAILHIAVDSGGAGLNNGTYTSVPVKGDNGSGTDAECTVTVAGGAITHVTMTTNGTGYKNAQLNLADMSGVGTNSGTLTLTPIISPIYGHGADPVTELGGNYVILNARLEYAEGSGDFPTDNDFRRLGLVVDPFNAGTTTVATATTLSAVNKFIFTSGGSISVDDIITNASSDGVGVAKGRVVSWNSSTLEVSYLPVVNSDGTLESFSGADTVYVSGASVGTISSITSGFPEVQRYSGHVTYIENRGAVSRAADQIEDIKLIIEM